MVVLTIVATIAISSQRLRAEERFPVMEGCQVLALLSEGRMRNFPGTIEDLSLSGAMGRLDDGFSLEVETGDWLVLDVSEVGRIAGQVRRVATTSTGLRIGLQFDLPVSRRRDDLIVKLFTGGLDNSTHTVNAWKVTWAMLLRVLKSDPVKAPPPRVSPDAPADIAALCDEGSEKGVRLRVGAWEDANSDGKPCRGEGLSSAA